MLLKDSSAWEKLKQLVRQQKAILSELAAAYTRASLIHEKSENEIKKTLRLFSTNIDSMEAMVKKNIDSLITITKDLIELVRTSLSIHRGTAND